MLFRSVRTSENTRLASALQKIEEHWAAHAALPTDEAGSELIGSANDQWGNPLQYDLKNNKLFLITSLGPDGLLYTIDDIRLVVNRNIQSEEEKQMAASADGDLFASLHPTESWLARRRAEKGNKDSIAQNDESNGPKDFTSSISVGGGEKLSGEIGRASCRERV